MRLFYSSTSPYARMVHIALREKGVAFELVAADPWADDAALREINPATRVPALMLDDGSALTESSVILAWLDRQYPQPGLVGDTRAMERAGLAIGVIDAAVHTIISRRVTAPAPFDDTPIGLRRRRTMVESMQRLEQLVRRDAPAAAAQPTLDVIASVVAQDYLQLRFADAPWRVATPALDAWLAEVRRRPAFADTVPR
ncbi:MAG: glutathione S-transferase N-terminal domain-containing protein [Betaproteobacteria bacterium]|nr:glutathione S-transferase N-terminal domain-containing protein [Betaproteobacteria bacterium]